MGEELEPTRLEQAEYHRRLEILGDTNIWETFDKAEQIFQRLTSQIVFGLDRAKNEINVHTPMIITSTSTPGIRPLSGHSMQGMILGYATPRPIESHATDNASQFGYIEAERQVTLRAQHRDRDIRYAKTLAAYVFGLPEDTEQIAGQQVREQSISVQATLVESASMHPFVLTQFIEGPIDGSRFTNWRERRQFDKFYKRDSPSAKRAAYLIELMYHSLAA